jgi:microcystin-dependent protein
MSTLQLVLSFLGGSAVGAFAGGWLARWTERENPLREHMLNATSDYADAVGAGIAVLANADPTTSATGQEEASEMCAKAVGTLGRLHILFDEQTYQEAEEAVAALCIAIRSGPRGPASRRSVEPVYRHLRAFADCAGQKYEGQRG